MNRRSFMLSLMATTAVMPLPAIASTASKGMFDGCQCDADWIEVSEGGFKRVEELNKEQFFRNRFFCGWETKQDRDGKDLAAKPVCRECAYSFSHWDAGETYKEVTARRNQAIAKRFPDLPSLNDS